jgi:Flp pilus assembly protein TadD
LADAQPTNVLALNNLAWVLGQSGDTVDALRYAQKAHDLAPNSAAVLDTFGTLLVNKGDVARGLPMLEQAVKLAPKSDAIRMNRAKALAKTGDKDRARSEFQALSKTSDTKIKTEAEAALSAL